ncbi:Long-chain-alcohol O-fatty-acyltransferase [Handroanthus impetiginosus]|uniref:Long-chain-alcohol O-fatty-acyltransferase n=1 Tax=Handroanthus impetiginosus TaxID=429701 RepID=A0A2G9HUW4_9LAMI|nr:Long-chain-alcohol O-fatty-acyltransferase [Handroanthus impetiginosus]
MEGEINNAILVWTTIFVSLSYCHKINQIFPTTNIYRTLSFLPIIILFVLLPLNLTSIHLGGTTSFFISWLGSFKLILFTFNKGPLSSDPPLPLSLFIPLACFPIKLQEYKKEKGLLQKSHKSLLINYAAKVTILAILVCVYEYKNYIHPHIILCLYCLHIYLMLDILLAIFASLSKALIGLELEPQFNEPYLATSLQDFWGRRWNLMVSNILRPTIYGPARDFSSYFMGHQWAPIPAVWATFLVSGIMHELVFYNFGRLRPTGEVTGFFVLHGVSLSVEIVVKKVLKGKLILPGIISAPLTLAYVMYTSFWLFFPPFLRARADVKGCTESLAFIEFVKTRRLVDPSELTCPFL